MFGSASSDIFLFLCPRRKDVAHSCRRPGALRRDPAWGRPYQSQNVTVCGPLTLFEFFIEQLTLRGLSATQCSPPGLENPLDKAPRLENPLDHATLEEGSGTNIGRPEGGGNKVVRGTTSRI